MDTISPYPRLTREELEELISKTFTDLANQKRPYDMTEEDWLRYYYGPTDPYLKSDESAE